MQWCCHEKNMLGLFMGRIIVIAPIPIYQCPPFFLQEFFRVIINQI